MFFPVLPVVREKDRWSHRVYGTPYKVRLCMDFKNGGLNDMFADWPFRYVGLHDIANVLRPGDWLATIDISRFYLRLPAGSRLRSLLWFQDPASYARSSHDNERLAKPTFRQLLAVAFGLKPAPAWASVVSAELARILRSHGVRVAGTYLDDLLICARSREALQAAIRTCESVCAALGLDLNDKTTGPCSPQEGIKYLGLFIRTADCSIAMCEQHRLYAVDLLAACLAAKRISLKQLESVTGVLSWISMALVSGRPRRNTLYAVVAQMKRLQVTSVAVRGALQRQLSWWLKTLRKAPPAASYFWHAQPDTPLVCSDASGEDGWAACVLGYHIVGAWPAKWRQSSGKGSMNMLFKELVAPVVAALLLSHCIPDTVMCCAVDNAGVAFVLNALSCGCPWSRALLRILADKLAANRVGMIAGHAHRHRNTHADDLSHLLANVAWSQVVASAPRKQPARCELHFAILDLRRREACLATVSFAPPTSPFVIPARR